MSRSSSFLLFFVLKFPNVSSKLQPFSSFFFVFRFPSSFLCKLPSLLPSPLKKRKNILLFFLFFVFYLILFRVFLIEEEKKLVAKIIYFLLIFFFLMSQKTNFLCDFSPSFCYCKHNSKFSFFYCLLGEFKAFRQ